MSQLLVVLLTLLAGCLIAESPAEVPVQTPERPTILEPLVVPTARAVLGSFPPSGFLVPVKLFNPQQAFEWRVFVDFDPFDLNPDSPSAAQGTSRPVLEGESAPGQEDVTADDPLQGIRRVKFVITPLDPTTCHTIEFVAATDFQGSGTRSLHAVDPQQSDHVVWFYSPSGDLAGCPVQDAGIAGATGAN